MIKNIIFDIGGVLLEYNPKTYLDKLNIEEVKRKEIDDIIFHNSKWKDCLNGRINNEELIEILIKQNTKYEKEIKQILDKQNLKYMLPPKNDMIEYYKFLKQKGYKIYLCSNITGDTYNYIRNEFDIIQEADGGVFSCFEHISKPNVEIYNKLIEKYNLNIEESVLVDDTKRNIISANEIGLRGIGFDNFKQLEKVIEELEDK